jgi:hypothetical protein
MKLRWIILIIVIAVIVILFLIMTFFYKAFCYSGIQRFQTIDNGIKNELINMFSDDTKIYIYPNDREVEVEKGTLKEGSAFVINNHLNKSTNFRYLIGVDPYYYIKERCNISVNEAESYLLINSGTKIIPVGSQMENPEKISFNIPKNAPDCVIIYRIDVMNDKELYASSKIYVKIIPRKNFIIRFKEYLIQKFYNIVC